MNRRGFFSKLLGRNGESDIFFYGVQLVINVGTDDATRKKLHKVINAPVGEETPQAKRAFYKRIASVLLEVEPFYEYGYWDYLTDADDAQNEFSSWVNEIEGSMATEEEEVGQTADEQYRMSADKTYLVITCVFMLQNVTALENMISMIEEIPEDEYFSRPTWTKLIDALNYVDFEYSLGDAVFIMPGNEQDGLSWEELHTEGWNYLKPIA
jgi:hypothetical protein